MIRRGFIGALLSLPLWGKVNPRRYLTWPKGRPVEHKLVRCEVIRVVPMTMPEGLTVFEDYVFKGRS